MHIPFISSLLTILLVSFAANAADTCQAEIATTLAAADHGDTRAETSLGFAYRDGQCVQQDYALAALWWRKAARQGGEAAEYRLGNAYHLGQGVTKDDSEAVDWWRKAAEQGNADAQRSLGFAYHFGHGIATDQSLAVKYWNAAAEQGDKNAQLMLGTMYGDGIGVARDDVIADKWVRLSAGFDGGMTLDSYVSVYRVRLESRMNEDQIEQAKALASKWKPMIRDTSR